VKSEVRYFSTLPLSDGLPICLTFPCVTAEAWNFATINPQHKVCCLSLTAEPRVPVWPWGAPPNLSTQVWPNSPSLPYGDGSVDIVSSRSIALTLRAHDWPPFLRDCARILKPQGILSISVLDPMPRNAGPLLQQWTTEYLILGLERRFLATRPAMVIPFWLKDVSQLTLPHIKTVTYSAVANDDTDMVDAVSPSLMGISESYSGPTWVHRRRRSDIQQLGTAVGRHFYQALYKELASEARLRRPRISGVEYANDIIHHWWWKDPAIVRECREYGTMFEMVTYTCLKRDSVS
jgi:SAM-dependent methyltransferase